MIDLNFLCYAFDNFYNMNDSNQIIEIETFAYDVVSTVLEVHKWVSLFNPLICRPVIIAVSKSSVRLDLSLVTNDHGLGSLTFVKPDP